MFKSTKKADLKPISDLVSLKGKSALITGAATGIGEAIAYRFAEAGGNLELLDINEELLEKVKDELSQFNVIINTHKVDLSKKEEIINLWAKINGNEPDILINNAGIYPFKNFLKVDDTFLQKVMNINFYSVFWMCQCMIGRRLEKGGTIINIGSIEAILPFKEDETHYDSSKAGVIGLTRALAKDYGKKGFKINLILPGGIITSGFKNAAKEILKLNFSVVKSGIEFKNRLPLGRFGQPDEVALIALVLACDLSSYVHGSLIPVDGGFLSA